uniref:MSP domain-containing protein n=1 Tax=Hanusia phi TaxID=3032 RepID=A0A7S0HY90_9CRYP
MSSEAGGAVTAMAESDEEVSFAWEKGKTPEGRLTIRNETSGRMLFKIKTTSPMRYTVKPHCGLLSEHEQITVTIKLHFRLTASTIKLVSGDKFLLQTSPNAPDGEQVDVKKIFASLPREDVVEKKISCKIKLPKDFQIDSGEEANMEESAHAEDASEKQEGAKRDAQNSRTEDQILLQQEKAKALRENIENVRVRNQSLQREYEEEIARNRSRLRSIEELQKNFEELIKNVEDRTEDISNQTKDSQAQSEHSPNPTLHLLVFVLGLITSLWLLTFAETHFPLSLAR